MNRTGATETDQGKAVALWTRLRLAASPTGNAGDAVFRGLLFTAALLVLLLVLGDDFCPRP